MNKISEAIEKFAQRERDEAEKACKEEKNQVNINPDSYIAKEIKYQTALIHGLQEEMILMKAEIKRDKETGSRSYGRCGIKGFHKTMRKMEQLTEQAKALREEMERLNNAVEKTERLYETGKTPIDKQMINRLREYFGRPPLPEGLDPTK